MVSLFQRTAAAFRAFRTGPTYQQRGFDGAKMGRLYADWIANATSSDAEIRGSFRRLLDRSRDLERNNDYQRGYLRDCEDNILGATRHDLRVDAGDMIYPGGNKPPIWKPDRAAIAMIEDAWAEWGRKGTCTIDRRHSWRNVKRLAVRAVPRDGNMIIRKILGSAAGNRFGFALELWDIDHLDLLKFEQVRGGGEIRFGIEFNAHRAVTAFWLRVKNPNDYLGAASMSPSVRFPADEIYHIYLDERPEQSIGLPWCVSAITRLRQLGAFEEAAVIAARLGASKAGFFKKTPGAGGGVGSWTGEKDEEGAAVVEAAAGTFTELPEGWDVANWSPEYPNIETSEFRKAMLRGIATSLGTSYTTLGNDLESVNYSSARVGLLDERETWKMHQEFFAEYLYEPVFADWLDAAITSGALNLPLAKFAKFNRPRFKGRRWAWVDPVKEVDAAKTAIALRLSSRRQIIDDAGGDIEDVFHDNKADEELADSLSLSLSLSPPDPEPESFGDTSKAPAKGKVAPSDDPENNTPPAKK
jgi:lambda family phage portal protein